MDLLRAHGGSSRFLAHYDYHILTTFMNSKFANFPCISKPNHGPPVNKGTTTLTFEILFY